MATDETGQSLHDRLAAAAPAALAEALSLFARGEATREPQDDALATHTGKLTREHGRLDWTRSAVDLGRQVRAFMPWPSSWCRVALPNGSEKNLKVFPPTQIVPLSESAEAGSLVAVEPDRMVVATGDQGLALTDVQLEGKKRVSVKDFLRGHALVVGDRLL